MLYTCGVVTPLIAGENYCRTYAFTKQPAELLPDGVPLLWGCAPSLRGRVEVTLPPAAQLHGISIAQVRGTLVDSLAKAKNFLRFIALAGAFRRVFRGYVTIAPLFYAAYCISPADADRHLQP